MKEFPILFGPEDAPLMGMVTTPASGDTAPVACLMLNMGAGYRIGPRRINVKLARRLAQHGISSLRLDLSGLGDSSAPKGQDRFTQQAVLDLQAAMKLLETTLGIQRFIVIGLCSGGGRGLSLAEVDPRVVGLFMFDSYAFPGRRARIERNLRRMLALVGNASVYGKVGRWLRRKLGPKQPSAQLFEDEPIEETQRYFINTVRQLVERGVAVFVMYTGTLHVRDLGRDQLGPVAAEPFAKQLEYRFIGEIDHTLTSLESQQTFLDEVSHWVRRVANGRPASRPALDAPPVQRAPVVPAQKGALPDMAAG